MASFPPLPKFSAAHPFRMGTPSYVYPADILPNVEALGPYVDDIELVLFESEKAGNGFSNIPSEDTIARLAELARQHDLTYTVHFPIDRHLGSRDAKERKALQKQMLAIMDRTRPLEPFAYILHLEGIARDSAAARVKIWQKDIAELLPALVERTGNPARLCVENLNYPFAWCEALIDTFDLGICIDVGHLWVGGCAVEAHLTRHLPRTRVIHLHGVRKDGHDHKALTELPSGRLPAILKLIEKFTGVLTLEIFSYAEVRDSITVLAESWRPGRTRRRPKNAEAAPLKP